MLAHVHIMKTAGQTVRGILRQSYRGRHCDLLARRLATVSDLHWAQRFYRELQSIAGHGVLPHANLEASGLALRYFTFMRDPLQRCVSHYQFSSPKRPDYPPFEEWIRSFSNFQTKILCGSEEAQRAIEILEEKIEFVGLVERFNESLVLLKHWSGDSCLDLHYRSVNVAADNTIKQRLLADAKIVALIHECHEQDNIVFRYARDVIYPRQVKKFGPGLQQAVADLEHELPGNAILSFEQFVASAKRNVIYKPLTRILRRAA